MDSSRTRLIGTAFSSSWRGAKSSLEACAPSWRGAGIDPGSVGSKLERRGIYPGSEYRISRRRDRKVGRARPKLGRRRKLAGSLPSKLAPRNQEGRQASGQFGALTAFSRKSSKQVGAFENLAWKRRFDWEATGRPRAERRIGAKCGGANSERRLPGWILRRANSQGSPLGAILRMPVEPCSLPGRIWRGADPPRRGRLPAHSCTNCEGSLPWRILKCANSLGREKRSTRWTSSPPPQ